MRLAGATYGIDDPDLRHEELLGRYSADEARGELPVEAKGSQHVFDAVGSHFV